MPELMMASLFGERKKKRSPKERHRAQRKRDDNNTRQVAKGEDWILEQGTTKISVALLDDLVLESSALGIQDALLPKLIANGNACWVNWHEFSLALFFGYCL